MIVMYKIANLNVLLHPNCQLLMADITLLLNTILNQIQTYLFLFKSLFRNKTNELMFVNIILG
jgi:hypothetical protein